MSSQVFRSMLAGLALVAMTLAVVSDASAQCATCPQQQVVAYSPVVAQPTVAYRPYTGWYPGKWIDQWRLRRAARTAPAAVAPTYAAAYAPTYSASYAPAYTTSYTPVSYTASYAPTYTTAYRPYVTSYAPLSQPVMSTCNSCVQTVARPVLMRPVVAEPCCDACSYTPDCGCNACSTGCDACSSGVSQAIYSDSGCSSCDAGSSANVVPPAASGGANVGPQTPIPSYAPAPAPSPSQYESQRQINGAPDPADDVIPGPVTDDGNSTYYNAPRLLDPRDRTARSFEQRRKPTVDVWTAVYRGPTESKNVSRTSTRRARTQAEIDAEGWTAVSR